MDRNNNGSSEEEVDVNNSLIDPQAEDRELKGQLLRKYSGYLGSLKQEFMKKRKKGKLPKEARQQLLDWWSRHYKWPYPSVSTTSTVYLSIIDCPCISSSRMRSTLNFYLCRSPRSWLLQNQQVWTRSK